MRPETVAKLTPVELLKEATKIDCFPSDWAEVQPAHDALKARLEAIDAWLKKQIAECEADLHPREPSIVVNHWLEDIERQNRTIRLVQLRTLNHARRILSGETPAYGCEFCTSKDACYDGSVPCVRTKEAT